MNEVDERRRARLRRLFALSAALAILLAGYWFIRSHAGGAKLGAQPWMFGGTPAAYPWMAVVNYAGRQCGATLIRPQWLLTAAHCRLEAGDPVYVGYSKIGWFRKYLPTARVAEICKITGHQTPRRFLKDLALVELSRSLSSQQVKLEHASPSAGTSVVVAGYGYQESGLFSQQLLKVALRVTSDQQCLDDWMSLDYPPKPEDMASVLCASAPGKIAGPCDFDSGGPLLLATNERQVGIVSHSRWYPDCGHEHEPALYTRTAPYAAWIESVVDRGDRSQCVAK